MKERGILFNQEMVRAILDGRKTQTRRVIKPQPNLIEDDIGQMWKWKSNKHRCGWSTGSNPRCCALQGMLDSSPFGKVGDRLYVRENFKISHRPHGEDGHYNMIYMADKTLIEIDYSEIDMGRLKPGKSYPSMHMPKWASRIWLEITGVRVERVQDISIKDILAEGLEMTDYHDHERVHACYYSRWQTLWNSCYPGSWERNDWVWVYEFKVIK